MILSLKKYLYVDISIIIIQYLCVEKICSIYIFTKWFTWFCNVSMVGINAEPPLQHKKRVEGPPASLSINFDDGKYEASDDFALLGQQHKFASNVRYGLRPAKASKLEGKQLDLGDKQLDMNNNNNNANRDLPPPPKQMKMGESQVCTADVGSVARNLLWACSGPGTKRERDRTIQRYWTWWTRLMRYCQIVLVTSTANVVQKTACDLFPFSY